MTSAALYILSLLASWAGIAALVLTLCRLFTWLLSGRDATVVKPLFSSLAVSAVCSLLVFFTQKQRPFLNVPVVWPIMPFAMWAATACFIAGLYLLFKAMLRQATFGIAAIWVAAGILFAVFQWRTGSPISFARGYIPFSPISAITLILLAGLATFAMANVHKAVRAHRVAKGIAVHLALAAGSVIFGIPFAWLLITSFKEERDMVSSNGLIWAPQVQETVSTFAAYPPIFVTKYQGREVRGTIMSHLQNGDDRLEIVDPDGLEGLVVDRSPDAIQQVPVDAPVVMGSFEGQSVTGMVLREYDDGSQEVQILKPPALKGKEFRDISANLAPVRHPGLRLKNYTDALGYFAPESDYGLVYVKNSLIIVIMSVIGTLLSSSVVAYAFSRLRFPGRDFLFGLLLSTMMLPSAVTLLPKFLIFRDLGWIDTLLPLWAPAFFASAFNVFMLRQFFRSIPVELEDSAKIDGCGYLRSYWSVMLPQIKPALAVVAIWTFIGSWNDFMGPLIYINSPENMPISYAVQIFSTDHGTLPGLTMAVATMAVVPVILLFFFSQRYFIDGVTLSGFGGK